MPTIVSRLYETTEAANSVASELRAAGFPDDAITVVIAPGGADQASAGAAEAGDADQTDAPRPTPDRVDAAALVSCIEAAVVRPSSAEAYAKNLTGRRALLVVRAPVVPFGAARKAMEIVDATPSIDVGVSNPNEHVPDKPNVEHFKSTLSGHPRFLSQDFGPGRGRSLFSDAMGFPLLSRSRERRSAIKGGKRFLTGVRATPAKPRNSVISGGGHPLSRMLGLALLSRRRKT